MSRSSQAFFTGATVATLFAAFSSASLPAEAAEDACTAVDVDYAVNATLTVRDTLFGAGNATYPLGQGKARVRFESHGAPATARLLTYELDNRFTAKASFAAWFTAVATDSHTSIANECTGAAVGTFDHGDVVWQTPVEGYRSDGTLTCSGNVCGMFGAPPAGTSPIHQADPVKFSTFHFASDGKTFTMGATRVSHTDSPKQTSYLALSGREVRRSCVTSVACQ